MKMKSSFNAVIQTPAGPQRGILTLEDKNGELNGSIRAMGSISFFRDGKTDGSSFTFSGILGTGLFRMRYSAEGTISGDRLTAAVTTVYGKFRITGTKRA